ncbi:MAG TPA: methyltransferase domain-containing protein, partial [Paracoccaceae bacterium]|nr:methyltransferase domain-containing protein [Paracoccaceae bacterium]
MTHEGDLYDEPHIAFLERLWGDGYLSPGGAGEVRRVLDGLDLTGRTVVDIGCGSGGITVALARDFGAGRVIGLDVEAPVCAAARRRADAAGLAGRIEIRQIEPGPMPLPDGSADIVFSKDSIVHIPDKDALAHD